MHQAIKCTTVYPRVLVIEIYRLVAIDSVVVIKNLIISAQFVSIELMTKSVALDNVCIVLFKTKSQTNSKQGVECRTWIVSPQLGSSLRVLGRTRRYSFRHWEGNVIVLKLRCGVRIRFVINYVVCGALILWAFLNPISSMCFSSLLRGNKCISKRYYILAKVILVTFALRFSFLEPLRFGGTWCLCVWVWGFQSKLLRWWRV